MSGPRKPRTPPGTRRTRRARPFVVADREGGILVDAASWEAAHHYAHTVAGRTEALSPVRVWDLRTGSGGRCVDVGADRCRPLTWTTRRTGAGCDLTDGEPAELSADEAAAWPDPDQAGADELPAGRDDEVDVARRTLAVGTVARPLRAARTALAQVVADLEAYSEVWPLDPATVLEVVLRTELLRVELDTLAFTLVGAKPSPRGPGPQPGCDTR